MESISCTWFSPLETILEVRPALLCDRAIAQNNAAIAELREVSQHNSAAIAQLGHQLGESVSDLIHTIDYAIDALTINLYVSGFS
ncbi:hypothetical protein [Nostoc flagelliforme]|uniref:hypothetical protein n=1 Tax=Nostoc flagelliforme TaxID=1306274 RepID=UPI001F55021E|nr:hypothetical protein [Nostoc flagelliforme]